MGTSYLAIYKRAITELKDPHIKSLFNNDEVLFNEVMYNFLENAISLFTNPIVVVSRLQKRSDPYTIINNFIGDGITNSFIMSEFPNVVDKNNLLTRILVNNEIYSGIYDISSNKVTINSIPPENSYIEITIYFTGEFQNELYDQEIYILSQLLVSCWSEYVNNDKLDIIRLLGDTDFKLPSNSTTTSSKVNWNIVNRETAIKRMNKFAWDAKMLRLY